MVIVKPIPRQNSQGFILISILILIALISAMVVGIMSSIHLQNVLQTRLTEQWQIQQALNWSRVKLEKDLPTDTPDRCEAHLCTETDLIDQQDWTSLALPSVFNPMISRYVASQFEVGSQTVKQAVVQVRRYGKVFSQMDTIG